MNKVTVILFALLCSMQIMAQDRVEVIRKKLFSCQKDMIKNRKISIVQKFRYLMMIYVPVGYKILWNILKKLKLKEMKY